MKSVFLKAGMVILGILLCANLAVTIFGSPKNSYAFGKNFQYKAYEPKVRDMKQFEAELNKLGSEGWEVVATIAMNGTVILKK